MLTPFVISTNYVAENSDLTKEGCTLEEAKDLWQACCQTPGVEPFCTAQVADDGTPNYTFIIRGAGDTELRKIGTLVKLNSVKNFVGSKLDAVLDFVDTYGGTITEGVGTVAQKAAGLGLVVGAQVGNAVSNFAMGTGVQALRAGKSLVYNVVTSKESAELVEETKKTWAFAKTMGSMLMGGISNSSTSGFKTKAELDAEALLDNDSEVI